MIRNLSQPFLRSKYDRVYLLIELGDGTFLEFWYDDGHGADYCTTYSVELHNSADPAVELVAFLQGKGFAVNSFRELARQTEIQYSFVDETPGRQQDVVCLHVLADRTTTPIDAGRQDEARFVSLDNVLSDLGKSVWRPSVLVTGIASLLAERDVLGIE